MNKIWNLTQHAPTAEQVNEGVIDFPYEIRADLATLMTFDTLPTPAVLYERADILGNICTEYAPIGSRVLIGGAPYFMCQLQRVLVKRGYRPVYALGNVT